MKKNQANIILIGFMGVGKGQTARMLAEKTGKFAVDCDDLIESLANKKVKKIFSKFGEKRFREFEREVAIWLEKYVTNTIVSTGGGFFAVPNIRKIGTVVYLHSDFNKILETIHAHSNGKKKVKKRPLLQDLKAARALFEQRLPTYRDLADFEVQVGEKNIEEVVADICQHL